MYKTIIRPKLRSILFTFVQKLCTTQEFRDIIFKVMDGVSLSSIEDVKKLKYIPADEYDLGITNSDKIWQRDDIIFITGRFRSGSTLLWNLFRKTRGVTAYYEPFNERQWFNPHLRGERIDATHLNTEKYWNEYEGLQLLGNYYNEDWTTKKLFMRSDSWSPLMKRYIEILIENASSRPVLQFNRVDFRLPWLKANFPNAKIIHIFRHPRDQWCSFLMDLNTVPYKITNSDFRKHDHFYLLHWVQDLQYTFPFLQEYADKHPYQTFYYLWKLSFIFGKTYSDYSISFEELVNYPTETLHNLFTNLNLTQLKEEEFSKIIATPQFDKWRKYASEEWFSNIETECDNVIKLYLGNTKNSI